MMKNDIVCSAPGSLIISGSDGILFGKPALIVAIKDRVTFCLRTGENVKDDPVVSAVHTTVKDYVNRTGTLTHNRPFSFHYEIPGDDMSGFGFEQALIVASTCAFLKFYSDSAYSQEEINSLAYAADKKIHKDSLGFRTTASMYGGIIYFRKEFQFLKTISRLSMKIPETISRYLFLIEVGGVNKDYNTYSHSTERLYDRIEKCTKRMVMSISKEDSAFFEETVMQEELLIEKLRNINKIMKKRISELKKIGAVLLLGRDICIYAKDPQKLAAYTNKYNIPLKKVEFTYDGNQIISP